MSILVVAVVLFAFGVFAETIGGKPLALDRRIALAFRNPADPSVPAGPAWLREAARDVTSLGGTVVLGMIIFVVEGYLLLAREFAAAWLIAIAVLGGLALNNLLKLVIARPRPAVIAHGAPHYTKSFPSGHAAMSAITYLTIGALLTQTHPPFVTGLFIPAVATFLTFAVGVSRIYLGVHYPTDILGGWCVGAAWSMLCWQVMAWLHVAH
jgi:undecaprenyl-diphosphatase